MLSRGKIQEYGEAADSALRKMALLDTTAIPLDLLSSTERKAVSVLKQHALVTVDDKDLVAMHSLTQLAVRGQTVKGDRRALAAGVVRAIKEKLAKFHHHNPSTFFIGRRYVAHARAAAANSAAWGLIPVPGGGGEARGGRSLLGDVRVMCMSAGNIFQNMGGQYQQALGMYEFTLACTMALEGHDSIEVAMTYNNVAVLYEAQGKYEEALEMHRKSLDIKTRILGGDNGDSHAFIAFIADSWNNIGEVLGHMGKYDEALEMLAKSLETRTRIHGVDSHLDVAASYNNVAIIYRKQGKYEEALEMYRKSLDIRTRILGGDSHPSVADSFNNMATILGHQGKCEEALELHTRSLAIRTRNYGDSHPLVASSFHGIGVVYEKKGDRVAATEMFTKAYSIHLKMLGPDHPKTQALKPYVNE